MTRFVPRITDLIVEVKILYFRRISFCISNSDEEVDVEQSLVQTSYLSDDNDVFLDGSDIDIPNIRLRNFLLRASHRSQGKVYW